MKIKLIHIIGARPQLVKAAVVSAAIAHSSVIEEQMVHTGQHYDYNISGIFFDELRIPRPKINLGVGSNTHGKQTAKILSRLEHILIAENPDLVLVYGDTNSTLAGSLAAVKLHIPIAHIEAGMRSFNREMPEEINRVITDHIATLHFCATDEAESNLRKEGISSQIHQVGDVMYDCFQAFSSIAAMRWRETSKIEIPDDNFILLTLHRAENTDDLGAFEKLWNGLSEISTHTPIIFPAHPRTLKVLKNNRMSIPNGIHLMEPFSYLDMIQLEKMADIIITDSGGVQKEAYFAKTPCITLREETEWTELVDCGWNKLVGSNKDLLKEEVANIQNNALPSYPGELYGDGKTSEKIVRIIENFIH